MIYRPEIDGLRALAVLPVILFHAGFDIFSGGFVGVDVFFVISGYLITEIIYREIQNGTFSLVTFYERRIRRILPALSIVSLACIPFAWLWMLPSEFKGFSQSLVAVNTFTSNIYFLFGSSYFSPANDFKPMLHTWSLSIEEQFYLFFPLLLMLLGKFNRKTLFVLISILTLLSLGLAEIGTNIHPRANFFLLPTRAWELGVGALLAISVKAWRDRIGREAQIGSFIGLLFITYAIFAFDKKLPHPGLWTLFPVLGAALVIVYARPFTLVGKLLSSAPMVGIGMISYSAYLWHWPIFAFARIRLYSTEESLVVFSGLSILTFFLAYLSWKFVEQPVRNKIAFGRKSVFSGAVVSSICFILYGMIGSSELTTSVRSHGKLGDRVLDRHLIANFGLSNSCQGKIPNSSKCRTSNKPEILVWGDSYAMHLVDGILWSNPNAKIAQFTMGACGPFFDLAIINLPTYNKRWARRCLAFNKSVKNYVARNKSIDFVVLASPFAAYLKSNARVYYSGDVMISETEFVAARFKATLDWFVSNGIVPVIFAPPPGNGRDIGLCLARNSWFGGDTRQCSITTSDHEMYNSFVRDFLVKFEKNYKVVWVSDYFCDKSLCKVTDNDVFIYRDKGHLSVEGSRYIGKKMNFYDLITRHQN